MDERLRTAEGDIIRIEAAQSGHEQLCAERYGHINSNLTGLWKAITGMRAAAWLIAIGMLGTLVMLVYNNLSLRSQPQVPQVQVVTPAAAAGPLPRP